MFCETCGPTVSTGRRSFPEYFFRRRSEQRTADPFPPVRAHHDQVHLLLFHDFVKNGPQVSLHDSYLVGNIGQHLMQLLGFKFGLLLGGFEHLRHGLRADDGIRRREPDMQSMHFGAVLLCQTNRVRQGSFRGGRKIRRE